MEIRVLEREQFTVCGWAVETDAEQNDADISRLYRDFFETGKERVLGSLPGCGNGFYGLSWYTVGHERYCYMLGKKTERMAEIPPDAQLITIPGALFAVAFVQDSKEIKQAWTEFFYNGIPKLGCCPNEAHGYYFEYYPGSVYGQCELWVPVVRST
jgi:Uncharacterized protein conserved in bacteria